MKNKFEKDALSDYIENQVRKFDQYSDALEQIHRIFAQSNFPNIPDICDGFCPECELILECDGYDEEEWEGLYT